VECAWAGLDSVLGEGLRPVGGAQDLETSSALHGEC